jgi:tetratricopeptide (TPR) repeat protein
MGQMEASIAQLERSLAVLEEAGAIDTLQGAQLHYSLGSAHFTLTHIDEALVHVDASIEIMAKLNLRDSSDGIQVESSRLNVLELLKKQDEVDALYEDIMSRQREFLPDTHPRMVTMISNQARRLHNRGAAKEAVALMAPLEDHVRNRVPLENAGVNYFMAKLGYARCDAQAPAQGKADLEYALKSARAAYGSDNWYVADIIGAIGYCEIKLGAFDDAERNLQASYELFRELWGDEHYATQGKLKWLARLAERRADSEAPASPL